MRHANLILGILLAGTFLSGCSLAPTYHKPEMAVPGKYKETDALQGSWKISSENAGKPDQTAWWTIFDDLKLNQLEQLAIKENNSLKAAAARLNQSRASLREATAGFYPQVNATANAARFDAGRDASPASSFSIGAGVSYDGNTLMQISDIAARSKADTRASEALYRQALLMVQADVADNYFAILSLDTERDLLRKTTELRLESQKLIERRFKEGEAGEQDLLRAKAETSATQADLKALDQARAIREHALAVLVGKFPSDFTLEDGKLPHVLPRIPAGLPSHLLERRPDVAAAEQRMIQTNAQIGIARAAFFPNVLLTASGGLAASELGDVFKWSSRSWALGPLYGTAVSLPIFDMGRRFAQVDLAKEEYNESVDNYRQQVLVAFKDVEDNLSSLHLQAEQAQHLYQAAESATKAARISNLRYSEGETSYLEVLDTQRDTLSVQRSYTQVQGARFSSTINLIRALGGGWYGLTATAPKEEAAPLPSGEPKINEATPQATATPAERAEQPAKPVEKRPEPAIPVAPTQQSEPIELPKPVKPVKAPSVPQEPVTQKPATQAPAPSAPPRDFEDINPAILFD